MAITVKTNPQQLKWENFTEVPSLTNGEDAHIDPAFEVPVANIRKVDGQWALAEDFTIVVKPRARVLTSATKTDDLLAHEQGHYDIGFLAGRALGRDLQALRGAKPDDLKKGLSDAFDLHTKTRLGPIQKKYDGDTKHSQDVAEQARWNALITAGLAAAITDTIDGLPV